MAIFTNKNIINRKQTRKKKSLKVSNIKQTRLFYKKKSKNNVFTKKDYISGDGFLTSIWGPPLWHSLHTISFNYPNTPTYEDKINYRNFILNLQYVLPCKYCRINLKHNLKRFPLRFKNMRNRYTFSKYIYDLHELINTLLGKKSNLSYDDVRERYEHFRSRCDIDPDKYTKNENLFNILTEKREKQEKQGCVEPLYGNKSRCILKFVPITTKGRSIQISNKCKKKRIKFTKKRN